MEQKDFVKDYLNQTNSFLSGIRKIIDEVSVMQQAYEKLNKDNKKDIDGIYKQFDSIVDGLNKQSKKVSDKMNKLEDTIVGMINHNSKRSKDMNEKLKEELKADITAFGPMLEEVKEMISLFERDTKRMGDELEEKISKKIGKEDLKYLEEGLNKTVIDDENISDKTAYSSKKTIEKIDNMINNLRLGGRGKIFIQSAGADLGPATTINFKGSGVTTTVENGVHTIDIIKSNTYVTVGLSSSGGYYDYTGDGTADEVQINQALTAVSALGGGTVLVYNGTYDIQGVITIPSNTKLCLDKNAKLLRNLSYIGTSDKDIVNVSGTNAELEGGIIDGNGVDETNPSLHSYNVRISGSNTSVTNVKSINPGDGIDACFGIIGTVGTPVLNFLVTGCTAERDTDGHFIQTNYCTGRVGSCYSLGGGSTVVQDGFRTYGTSDVKFYDCVAEKTRVGFQSWDVGNRNIHFDNCHAIECKQHGFRLDGTGSMATNCSATYCDGRGLVVVNSLNMVSNFLATQNGCTSSYCTDENTTYGIPGTEGGDVLIIGNYNSVNSIRGEGSSASGGRYGCIIVGDSNDVRSVGIYKSGFRSNKIYGDNNKVSSTAGQIITDIGTGNIID